MLKKSKILFIVPLPPPVHGSSMVCQLIRQSEKINTVFECRYVNLSTSRRNDEIGLFTVWGVLQKAMRFCSSLLKTLFFLLFFKPTKCYLAITCHGDGFFKDAPFVLLCKLFRKQIIIHQHNKGMAAYVNKPLYRWLFPLVYRNTTVVLLSWLLYDDVSAVVKREQVKIFPNGI